MMKGSGKGKRMMGEKGGREVYRRELKERAVSTIDMILYPLACDSTPDGKLSRDFPNSERLTGTP